MNAATPLELVLWEEFRMEEFLSGRTLEWEGLR